MHQESVTAAARRDVMETHSLRHLAALIKSDRGWTCSKKAAEVRVSQMLAGSRSLPADAIPFVVQATRRTGVLGPISGAVIQMQAELASETSEPQRPGMAVVRSDPRLRDLG